MAKDEKLNKWIEHLTPRRAIDNFFDHATPVDSPDLDEICEPPLKCVPPEEEVTPVAGSSQGSQRSRVQKRKLVDEEQPSGNVSKKNDLDETQTGSFPNDSIFGTSEFPSRLESPSLVIPPRPNQRNKKRMSVTAFANAIQSQQSHVVNTSDDLGESSIPSVLGSPNKVTQRILRSKKHTSITMFKEPLGGKTTQEVTALSGLEESGLESSGIPSNLQSPEYVSSQNRSIHKSKSRVSTTTFKTMLKNQQEQDSEEIPSSLDSPEKVQQVDRFVSKSKTRMSTTAFLNVLENQRNEEEEVLTDVNFSDSQPDLQQSPDFQLKNQSSRMSKGSAILPEINSPSANVSTLRSKRSSKSGFEDTNSEKTDLGLSGSQQTSTTIEPRRSIRLNTNSKLTKTSFETSSKASDSEMSEKSSMPELESLNEFSPVTSPIQKTKSKQSKPLHSTVEPRNEILNRPSDQSHKQKSISTTTPVPSVSVNMTLEIPSQLDSPQDYKQYNRPGPASYKKRVSTTEFLTALSQKNDVVPLSDISTKGSTQGTSNEAVTPRLEISSPLVHEEVGGIGSNSRPSSRVSSKSSSSLKNSKRSTIPSSESDESNADLMFDESVSSIIKKINKSLRSDGRASNKSSASSKSSAKTTFLSNSDNDDLDNDNLLSKTATPPAENTREIPRSTSQAFNKSSTSSKSSAKTTRRSKSDDGDFDSDVLLSKSATPPAENTREIPRSTSQASNKSSASSKSSDKSTHLSKSDDSDVDNDLLSSKIATQAENTDKKIFLPGTKDEILNSSNSSTRSSISRQTPSPILEEMEKILRSSSRASESSSSSNAIKRKRIQRPEPDEDNDPTINKSPSLTVRNSSRPPKKSLPAFSRIILDSESESEPETSLSKQINEPPSTKPPSSVFVAVDEAKSSSLSSSGSRTRKSLKFGSPTTKEASSAIQTIVDNQPSTNEAEVEETPPSDGNSSNEESLEEEKSTDEIEEEEEIEEVSAKSRRSTHSSRASSKSSRKSGKHGMSPSNRYPALKNSTVVAGGAEFSGAPLSMSPIRPGEQGAPLLVLSTPKSSASESSKAGTVTSTNLKSPTPKTVKITPSHPSTPAPFARKRTRSTAQSPMFMNVMKSSVKKAIGNIAQNQQRVISATPTTSRVSVAKTPKDQQQLISAALVTSPVSIAKSVSSSKGLSISNPRKGKSLVMSAFEKITESSDTEWEEESEQEQVKPRCINIAFEEIVKDRSKDFVPLEKRLLADPVFQAKVKTQRAKVAAQKAAEEAAAAAKKNETKKKPRTVAARKKEEDNIANVATNKGNLRFYARTKVTKEALDAVHGLVGEWLDFTLEQMENFCIDEGKPSLDSWEDCYKMMRRQGIVKNYMEYSGLCHELLLNDECAQLLPTSFPPEYYSWKREAKRQKK